MKEEMLKLIEKLQYEINLLEQKEEYLTGVTIRMEELKELVKKPTKECTIPVVMGSTQLVVIRDWISPYNSNMKGNHAPAEYWAKKLGKDTNTFVKDFENGCLDQWFKVYCP